MKYSLGLDIGITSVGWAVVDEDKERIHDLGVRLFERAEDPQSGESLAKPRRDARSARRRLKRRRQRLNNLKKFFTGNQLLSQEEIAQILSTPNDPYFLRAKALQEKLTPQELFIALYHIAKRRGYKSNRKVEASEEAKSSETGRVLAALHTNEALLKSKGYKTVGEALAKDERYQSQKRNKRDSYTNSFARSDFIREIETILAKQKEFGLPVDEKSIQSLIYGVDDDTVINQNAIMYQRPFMTKELMEKMIGQCTFEPDEKRAPRGSYSFEVFRLASDLAHVVFMPQKGLDLQPDRITLSPDIIEKIIDYVKEKPTLTYKKVRELAGISSDYRADYVRGKISEDDPNGEKNIFGNLKAYHDIKKAFTKLPDEWNTLKNNPELLDQIALILTIEKDDREMKQALGSLPLSDTAKEALTLVKSTNFKTFGHLSTKALRKITPHIIAGNTYDKACELAGYDFREKTADLDQITNPVVKRAVSQANKVVKAIERKYGKPYFIRIETTRELAKNYKDRKNIEREQKENQAKNAAIIEKLKEFGITSPNGQQILKFKLYNEQNGKSLYSGAPIDMNRLFIDDNAYQIDHIIPFSRSGNDSLANKALVTTEENQIKGNKTPYEAFGGDEARWRQFVANVEATYVTRSVKEGTGEEKRENYKFNSYAFKKKNNLLIQDYINDEWNARAISDTHYITRFISNYLKKSVDFAEGSDKQRVFTPNGTLTAYMRRRWGLAKSRDEDVLHHAKDAAVVAVMSQKMIQQANYYSKSRELTRALKNAKTIQEKTNILTGEITADSDFEKANREYSAHKVLTEDHFPQPWSRFRDEVDRRTRVISPDDLQNEMRGFDNYDEEFRLSVKPIFVSRMPNRKAKGAAHKETLRSAKSDENSMRTVRTSLSNVKLKDLESSPVKDTDPQLYHALKERLEQYDNKPEKAFAEPVYKKDKNGNNAHQVRTIKVSSKQPSGFYINDGKAFVNNGSMVRLDVYQKTNSKGKVEHFFVPVYTYQIPLEKQGQRITKILPEPKGFMDVDDTFTKVTSLFSNDYVRVRFDNRIEEGYYVMFGITVGQMVLTPHSAAGKSQENLRSISPRSAASIERHDISILGDNLPRV